ncbi:hypothetical protein OPV22_008418 [Ensete ventricosum]|uniref:Uncharacterized protein n=1 Tax=Ensete ventricosum TaxID=4639 RepID=A0AAV8R6J6_ENSVE|nr:hypothetical protein OPV22_008418 [Ensete ventricosum]
MDLSMKHEYLPEDLQALQTPFRSYLKYMLALACMSVFRFGNEMEDGYFVLVSAVYAISSFRLADKVKKENAEREALGALPLYQRTIP